MRICHVSDAHRSLDDRIYLKECQSLAAAGYETYYVVRGKTEERGGVHIIGCGQPAGRLDRMIHFSKRIYQEAMALDCDIYHLHDPELLPYALKLKRKGKKVIFDSHEDVPAQILDKPWLPKPLRRIVSRLYKRYETHVVKKLDAVVAATPHIGQKFAGRAKKVVVVNNYPKLDDIVFQEVPFKDRDRIVCYAGGLDEKRGEGAMKAAMKGIDGLLILAGNAAHVPESERISQNIRYTGILPRSEVNELYGNSRAGLVLLLPTASYVKSLPVKMFEYMAAGLPVIASDFPLWQEIIMESGCGICVNPKDAQAVKDAIEHLLDHPQEGQEMGRRGREAVVSRYHWKGEGEKLVQLMKEISGI